LPRPHHLESTVDTKNTFDTPTIAKLHRLEYGVALAVVSGLSLYHWRDIRIAPALLLFTYIDLIGYIPGAIAAHRSKDGRVPKIYYLLYNSFHSFLSAGAVCALWAWLVKPEWALLAVPTHLFIDRAIFGNQLKPFSVPFEPKILPEFERMLTNLRPAWEVEPEPVPVAQSTPAAQAAPAKASQPAAVG